MTELIQFTQLHTIYEWMLLCLTSIAVFVFPRVLGLNFFNGLIVAQIMTVINSVPIIVGLVTGYVPISRIAHFYLTESFFFIVMVSVYSLVIKYTLPYASRIKEYFNPQVMYALIIIAVALAAMAFIFTPQDGSSRIEYQVNYWYSLAKPITQIGIPVCYIASFITLFSNKNKHLSVILIACAIMISIFSGSKGSFILFSLTSFFAVRDIKLTPKFHIQISYIACGTPILFAALMFTLDRLRLGIEDIFDRIVLFSEPTLLVYYAGTPTAACSSLSILAKVHRGWARALGDTGASDINTLFGYAWNIYYTGVNTFTGPNARFSSYLICNFSDYSVLIGLIVTLLYFFLIIWVIKLANSRGIFLAIAFPFILFSLNSSGQDYNVLMQDINYLSLFVLILILRKPLKSASSYFAPRSGKSI